MLKILFEYKSVGISIVLSVIFLSLSRKYGSIYPYYLFLVFFLIAPHKLIYTYLKKKTQVDVLTKLDNILIIQIVFWIILFIIACSFDYFGKINLEKMIQLIPNLLIITVGLSSVVGWAYFFKNWAENMQKPRVLDDES